MKRLLFTLVVVLLILLLTTCAAPTIPTFSATIQGKVSAYTGDVTKIFAIAQSFPLREKSVKPYIENQYVIRFSSEKTSLNVKDELQNLGILLDELCVSEEIFYLLKSDLDIEELRKILSTIPGFLSVELAHTMTPCASVNPNDPYYNQQWNLNSMNLPLAWSVTTGTDIVTIAVIDTGVDFSHEDLSGIFVSGYDFVERDDHPQDEDGHGTHVVGIIAALTNNNKGVAGVAWGQRVKIMPLRIIGKDGSGTDFDFAKAVVHAVDRGAKIINVSLGASGSSAVAYAAVRYAYQNDVVLVCAAGNENGPVNYPAAYSETIAVGAVTASGTRASYSNFGPQLDIVAPGGDAQTPILSTYPVYLHPYAKYIGSIGTSMAAPHVTGLIALMISQGIVGVENIRNVLRRTAIDLGPSGYDIYYGAGLVDAYRAVTWQGGWQPLIVFALDRDGKLAGQTHADGLGRFELTVTKPEVRIYAWLDFDGNGDVSYGDLYGYYGYNGGNPLAGLAQTLFLTMNEVRTIDFNIAPIVDTSNRPSLSARDIETLAIFKKRIIDEHYKSVRGTR